MVASPTTTGMGISCWGTTTNMPDYQIVREPNMNRLYITGNTTAIRDLLYDFRARSDGGSYWLPLHMEAKFRAALKAEAIYQADLSAKRAAWESAKSEIPTDYKTRHGAMYGGVVSFGGQSIAEPGITAPRVPWVHVARFETRVRDLTGQSSINGRVQDSDDLYRAITDDGRTIYRIASNRGFGDDLRETYYLPPDLWERLMAAEVHARGITRQRAEQWLSQSRGCVGTELYEFAARPSAITQ